MTAVRKVESETAREALIDWVRSEEADDDAVMMMVVVQRLQQALGETPVALSPANEQISVSTVCSSGRAMRTVPEPGELKVVRVVTFFLGVRQPSVQLA